MRPLINLASPITYQSHKVEFEIYKKSISIDTSKFQKLGKLPNKRQITIKLTHTYTHTYIHTYIHAYIHACMHTYIHTYIHALIYMKRADDM